MGINHRLTTAYHPQGNGQTERTNQTVEQYLRHYINYQQDDWVNYLPTAQFAFNNTKHTATQETPFFANYRYHPFFCGKLQHQDRSISENTENKVDKMRDLHTQLSQDIDFMNMRSAVYYNKHQKEGPIFKRGEKAFLLHRNIKMKQPSQKLDHQKIGPFTIKEKIG